MEPGGNVSCVFVIVIVEKEVVVFVIVLVTSSTCVHATMRADKTIRLIPSKTNKTLLFISYLQQDRISPTTT